MSALTIATVLRSGGDYGPAWFWALKRGLKRHMTGQYRSPLQPLDDGEWTLKCLTDMEVGHHGVPLVHGWPGWWSKIELFRAGLFEGRVLYLDLDTLPVGDLSDLAAYDGPFAMLSDFYQPKRPASGVMAWEGDECAGLYETFLRAPPDRFNRRMDYWLERHATPMRLQDHVKGICSLKRDARAGPPDDAVLVCGHGQPRFSNPAAGWAHREWSALK